VAYNVNFLIGTAWLSSARVVECSIHLLNERNLHSKYIISIFFKDTFTWKLKEILFNLPIYYKANNKNFAKTWNVTT